MTIAKLFEDKSIKAKSKAKHICEWLLNGELTLAELLQFTESQSPINLATSIEAIECATKKSPDIADIALLENMTSALMNDDPRVKWESAKVIGNIAKKFPKRLERPTENLLYNTNNVGTVVRWATAYALGEILKLNTENNNILLPKIEILMSQEKDKGVYKKIRTRFLKS